GRPGEAAMSTGRSRALKIGFPRVDRDGKPRFGAFAPDLRAVEDDGIDPLRIFALSMGIVVGKDEGTLHHLNRADLAAGIARQPGMRPRMGISRADPVAGGKSRPGRRRSVAG